ncbi:WhiB family transcriptional regulator [Mycobacterium branderi]|uniref:Transcriptional regulator WhiB6 n=1 Tax=Mycobacterium branderi TaxID=43348 RepID=A0ABN6BGE4_9MYCO|nr:WhiB family transcriptional regulator [Mycobacterium branderi]BBZ15067.1 putative transcriptional regulator WhiB6 [Mycobacterium branderi]
MVLLFGALVAPAQWEERHVAVTLDAPRGLTSPPCLSDPDRWAAGGDDPELKALCRACPRRWLCAREALKTPGAQGMWSAVHIPKAGRGRTFALRQLRSLAAHGGYQLDDSA